MPDPRPRPATRARLIGLAGSAALLAVFFLWALVEPVLRASGPGAAVFAFLERPLVVLGELSLSLLFLIKAVVFLALLALVTGWMSALVRAFLSRGTPDEEGRAYAIAKAAGYGFFTFGCIVGLQMSGINLSSLAVLGGALGLGIGLGLQQSANNFLSGIILLVEQPIKVGDRVEVGNLDGDVIRIGSRATWVRTNANINVIVPNSEFVTRQVINWTATDRQVRFNLEVGVSYKADPAMVREALLSVATRNPDVLERPAPDVLFTGFGDSALNFTLRVWTVTQVRTPSILRSALYFEIFEELRRRGIEIPYPQRDLHLRSSDVPLGPPGVA